MDEPKKFKVVRPEPEKPAEPKTSRAVRKEGGSHPEPYDRGRPFSAWEFSERFRKVSNRYPRRVTEAFGGDVVRAMAATDEEVRATVRAWEIEQGLEPRDWEAFAKEEEGRDEDE